ncbi:MFS transporter [Euhalothece natronophila Z-M001]|uniref:MFS transporter n=1 Tax=Euhalothece natronophila Z-M001 TaxID=522448 RepID=A0A5B8NQG5_9CHRO|nr:MFS transporter [Euhalothece natronophila]QDZ41218.1 MFS transporter [Euhalothece natronophila Z-M001]
MASSTQKLKTITKLAYGAGDLGPAMTANILVFFLMFFFTQVAGLPPGLAGSILMIGRISDAINDPIIGVLSDRANTRWGRRLPWMFFGAIPFALIFILLWLVPEFSENETLNNWLLFSYYVVIAILFHIAYTVVNLPYIALTPELTQDYDERTGLNSFRFAFSLGASILSLVLAGVAEATYADDPRRQYVMLGSAIALLSVFALLWCSLSLQEREKRPLASPSRKKQLTFFFIFLTVIFLISSVTELLIVDNLLWGITSSLLTIITAMIAISLWFHRTHLPFAVSDVPLPKTQSDERSFKEKLKIVWNNRPFLYIVGIYLFSWLAVQLTASILPYFVVSWMGLSEQDFIQAALAVQGTALVMLFFWVQVSKRFEKKVVYTMGVLLWMIAQIGLILLQPGQVMLMYGLAVLAGTGVSVAYLIPWSMLPDVIELDELRTGERREGIFSAFMVFLQKMGLGLGLFLVGQALELAGFVETVPGEPPPDQPETALLAIRATIGVLPMLNLLAGLVLAYFYPLTRDVHKQICLDLAEKQNQEKE